MDGGAHWEPVAEEGGLAHQSGRTHDRFYWLSVPKETAKAGQTVCAEVKGQNIVVTAVDMSQLTLRLNDGLLDLDQSGGGERERGGEIQREDKTDGEADLKFIQ